MRKKDILIVAAALGAALLLVAGQFIYQAVPTASWGLHFSQEGSAPQGPASSQVLSKYDAAYLGNTQEKVLYLTFDAGYENGCTAQILDALQAQNVKAAFFLVGNYMQKNPDLVRRMVQEGHIVANHTYSHRGVFPLSSGQVVMRELLACRKSIKDAVGFSPLLFRPPFGVTNPIIGRAVNHCGLKTIGWSVRSLDTVEDKSRAEVWHRVVSKLHPGAIILLHDRCAKSDELLESIIHATLKSGYKFIALSDMLKIDVYED